MTHQLIEAVLREADAREIDAARLASLTARYALDTSRNLLDDLAEHLARSFVDGATDFETAIGVMNWLMPTAGFEQAPVQFWTVYVALEDSEVDENPSTTAAPRLRQIIRAWDAV